MINIYVIIKWYSRGIPKAQWLAKNQFADQHALKKGHVTLAFVNKYLPYKIFAFPVFTLLN